MQAMASQNEEVAFSGIGDQARTRLSFIRTIRSRRASQIERNRRRSSILNSLNEYLDDDDVSMPLAPPGIDSSRRFERRGSVAMLSLEDSIPSQESKLFEVPLSPPDLDDEPAGRRRSRGRRHQDTIPSQESKLLEAPLSPPDLDDEPAVRRRSRGRRDRRVPPIDFASSDEIEFGVDAKTNSLHDTLNIISQPTIDDRPIPMKRSSSKKKQKKKRKSKSRRNASESFSTAPPSPGLLRRRNSVTKYSASMAFSPLTQPPLTQSPRRRVSVLGDGMEYEMPLNDESSVASSSQPHSPRRYGVLGDGMEYEAPLNDL
eukprot:scaffold7330_cov146-Cylindrotheca_fusiformis.AAC.7